MRRRIGQDKRHNLPFRHEEVADGFELLALQGRRGAQYDHVGTRDGTQGAVVHARNPRNERTVVEAQDQLCAHDDPTALADDQAHHIRCLSARRHEVDERDRAAPSGEIGLQDEGIVAISPCDVRLSIGRRDKPTAVLGPTQQCGETGATVKARPA